MTYLPTSDSLYSSARRYARLALEAHAKDRHHLVALDAGTALEHLAKACLVQRSPVLIAEFKNESSFKSVLLLLQIDPNSGHQKTGSAASNQLRTVGLRGALERMRQLASTNAEWNDLMSLADMRDGCVHAASSDEVELKLLVAFAKHVNILLADLPRDRSDFWGSRLSVIQALLDRARDSVVHAVNVKLAAAQVKFQSRLREPLILQAMQQMATAELTGLDAAYRQCPACGSQGRAMGGYTGDIPDPLDDPAEPLASLEFTSQSFRCAICGLYLDSPAEIEAAGMQLT
jgi:hypothetical protein